MKYILLYCFALFLIMGMSNSDIHSQTNSLVTSTVSSAAGNAESDMYSLTAIVGQLSPANTAMSQDFTLYSGYMHTLGSEALSIASSHDAAEMGEDLEITVTFSPQESRFQDTLYFREAGAGIFQSMPLTLQQSTVTITIDKNLITDNGFEYYISGRDHFGNQIRKPAYGVISVPVKVPEPGVENSAAQPHGTAQTAYRLVSFPLLLSDKSPKSVLEDDLGIYDNRKWRFFRLHTDQEYVEYSDIETITAGEGYFLIVKDAGKILDSGQGETFKTDEFFSIPLNSKFTFIGNPFNFSIPLKNLRLASGQSLDIRYYDGMNRDNNWPDVTDADFINPFEGYLVTVNNERLDTLYIDPYLKPADKNLLKKDISSKNVDYQWAINIAASCQDASDGNNIAAVEKNASKNWDIADRPEPPVIGEYVSVFFPHEDWDKPLKYYCTDVRPESVDGEVWEFEVKTNIDDKIDLTFAGIKDVPSDLEVWLIDEALNLSQNLRERNTCPITGTSEECPKKLKLLVGSQNYIDKQIHNSVYIPDAFKLLQNFPNPFNPVTTIGFDLPVNSKVTLKILNALGQEVAVLSAANEFQAGRHTIIWDGRNKYGQKVGSGVYFYQIYAGEWHQVRKLLLLP